MDVRCEVPRRSARAISTAASQSPAVSAAGRTRTRTSCPRRRNAATSERPRKPFAPVTTALTAPSWPPTLLVDDVPNERIHLGYGLPRHGRIAVAPGGGIKAAEQFPQTLIRSRASGNLCPDAA